LLLWVMSFAAFCFIQCHYGVVDFLYPLCRKMIAVHLSCMCVLCFGFFFTGVWNCSNDTWDREWTCIVINILLLPVWIA
jgi:TRAP-type C4-dicarboxylate transport system permease small subunit